MFLRNNVFSVNERNTFNLRLSKYGNHLYFFSRYVSLLNFEHCCALKLGSFSGHGFKLQTRYLMRSPTQNAPSFSGLKIISNNYSKFLFKKCIFYLGLSHSRLAIAIPPPHVLEHSLYSVQFPHWPSVGGAGSSI